MKDESQQQVPPGIVAGINKHGTVIKFHGNPENYNSWYNQYFLDDYMLPHTISVDGKEYSVNDTVFANEVFAVIHSFSYYANQWWFEFGEGLNKYSPSQISKIPPPVQATINEHDDKPELEGYLKNLKPQPVQWKEELTKDQILDKHRGNNDYEWDIIAAMDEYGVQCSLSTANAINKFLREKSQPPLTEQGKEEDEFAKYLEEQGFNLSVHAKIENNPGEKAIYNCLSNEYSVIRDKYLKMKSLPKEPSEEEIEKAMEDLIPLADRNDDTLSVCDMLDIDSDQTERRMGFRIAITWLSSYKKQIKQ